MKNKSGLSKPNDHTTDDTADTQSNSPGVPVFNRKGYDEFEVRDTSGQTFGVHRVYADCVCWKPRKGKQWFVLPWSQFSDVAAMHGSKGPAPDERSAV